MLEALALTTLRAARIGPVAARAVREGARGAVQAVFDRSLYLALGDAWLCAGPGGLGIGPLNVLCEPWPAPQRLGAVLQVGDRARVAAGVLRVGEALAIDLAAAQPWRPDPPGPWSKASLARGLAALAAALPGDLPRDGLARLLQGGCDTAGASLPVLAAARAPVRYLDGVLAASVAGGARGIDAGQLVLLVGLGPGLTPSGDDYIGGALVALAVAGRTELRDRLWRALEPQLAGRTGDISRAHLGAAAEGYGSAALHDLLNAVLAGRSEAIPPALAAVAAIGHTSGWDALAGAAAALRAAVRGRQAGLGP